MKHAGIVLLAALLAVGCGDSASNNDDNASTGNNGTPNSTANGATNGAANGVAGDGPGWGATIDEAPVELPAATSATMTAVVNSGVLSLAGASADGQVHLTGAVDLGGDLELKEYAATSLQLGFGEPPYACSQVDGLTVTVTVLDPIEGTFAGPMECQHLSDASDTFDIMITDGWFRGGTITQN